MENLGLLTTIAAVYLAAAALPGPNTMLILHHAAAGRRSAAFAVVAGVCTGSVLWVGISLLGFGVVLQQLGWMYAALRIAGGLYLVWLGGRLLTGTGGGSSPARVPSTLAADIGRAYRLGLLTAMTNPKSAAFWTSVFLVAVPGDLTFGLAIEIVALIVCLSVFWHGMLAVIFALPPVRGLYDRWRRALDRIVGIILIGFGVSLAIYR